METKKSKMADLENKRSTFFLIGLTAALSAVFLAFKPTGEVSGVEVPEMDGPEDFVMELPPSTKEEEKVFVLPPKLKLFNKIIIVDDKLDIPEPDIKAEDPSEIPVDIPTMGADDGADGSNDIVFFPSNMPEFPGGSKSLNRWLSDNIKYPPLAVEMGLQGRVYLNFIIDSNGSISSVKITRGIDDILDNEAVRVVKSMPKWKPGLQNGHPVKVSFNMYVTFKLD